MSQTVTVTDVGPTETLSAMGAKLAWAGVPELDWPTDLFSDDVIDDEMPLSQDFLMMAEAGSRALMH